MAEVVIGTAASVITLVSLLTNCVEAFELIHIAKNQEKDLEKLDLKLMLEQCRLKAWGKSMGLIHEDGKQRRNLLDGFEFREVVQQALQHILTVLTDSNCLSKKYGGRQMAIEASSNFAIESGQSPSVSKLMAAFKRIKITDNVREGTSKAKSTSVWVFQDRKKYLALISEVQDLVDTIEKLTRDIVSQAQQEQFMVSRINAISDLRTLNMVTEVCEETHPAYSDAASNRADVVSMSTSRRGDVAEWIEQVDSGGTASDDSDDMESWDVTEWKRRYLTLRKSQVRAQDGAENTESGLAQQEDELTAGTNKRRVETLNLDLLERERSDASEVSRSRYDTSNLYHSLGAVHDALEDLFQVSKEPLSQSANMMLSTKLTCQYCEFKSKTPSDARYDHPQLECDIMLIHKPENTPLDTSALTNAKSLVVPEHKPALRPSTTYTGIRNQYTIRSPTMAGNISALLQTVRSQKRSGLD